MSDHDFAKLWAEHQQRMAEEKKAAKQTVIDICEKLKPLGIATVAVSYSGYGDSGATDSVDAWDSDKKAVDVPKELQEQLEEAVDYFLPEGYEINEGGQGTVTIEVSDASITVEHGQNETQVSYTTEEY